MDNDFVESVIGILISVLLVIIVYVVASLVHDVVTLGPIRYFDTSFFNKTTDMPFEAPVIPLGRSASPTFVSFEYKGKGKVPDAYYYGNDQYSLEFAPRLLSALKCVKLKLPLTASGIYVISMSQEVDKIIVTNPSTVEENVSLCPSTGYSVNFVVWAQEGNKPLDKK